MTTTNIKKQTVYLFIHNKTGIKINEKHKVRVAFVEIQLWPVK